MKLIIKKTTKETKRGDSMKINIQKTEVAMARACITISEIEKITGIKRQAITAILKGKRNPKPATIGKIAKALNCDVTDLLEE